MPSRSLQNYSPQLASRVRASGAHGLPGFVVRRGSAGVSLGPGREAGAAGPSRSALAARGRALQGLWSFRPLPKKLGTLLENGRACRFSSLSLGSIP